MAMGPVEVRGREATVEVFALALGTTAAGRLSRLESKSQMTAFGASRTLDKVR